MDKNRKIAIALVSCLVLALTASTLFITIIPVSEYGVISLYNERTDERLSAGDTLNVQDGDTLTVWLKDDPTTNYKPTEYDISAGLYVSNTLVEAGARSTYLNNYKWTFDLTACPTGTNTYHIYFSAPVSSTLRLGQDSFNFVIVNDELPTYEDADILTTPDATQTFDVGTLTRLTWTFSYDGPCKAYVLVNDVKDSELTFGISTGERTFNYLIDTSVAGEQRIIFTVEPLADNDIVSSSAIIVTIECETTTSTTSTTTTETGTATGTITSTITPTPDIGIVSPTDVLIGSIILGGGFMLVILIVIWRRK